MEKITILCEEVQNVLKSLGYEDITLNDKISYFEIIFKSPWDLGSSGFKRRHKDAISLLTKGYLLDIEYMSDRHYIHLHKHLKGIEPDNDRYGCMIYTAMKVDDEDKIRNDVFVNHIDYCDRVVCKSISRKDVDGENKSITIKGVVQGQLE